jgi:hypothetical protein
MKFEIDGPLSILEGDQIDIVDDIRRGDIVWFDRIPPNKLVMRIASASIEEQCYRIDRGDDPDALKLVAVNRPNS